MSIELPPNALDAAKFLHIENLSTFKSIGYVCYGFAGSEVALDVITQTNAYLNKSGYRDFCLFSIEKDIPITTPLFSKYSIMDISTHRSILVAFDLPSWQAGLLAPSKNKFLYAYDMPRFLTLKPNVIAEINKSEVKIIPRTSAYKQLLKSLGLKNVLNENMEYFDINTLLRIVDEH